MESGLHRKNMLFHYINENAKILWILKNQVTRWLNGVPLLGGVKSPYGNTLSHKPTKTMIFLDDTWNNSDSLL